MGLSQQKCLNPARALKASAGFRRKPIPYAFSRTLYVFSHFRIIFMAHFMTHISRYVYLSGTSSKVREISDQGTHLYNISLIRGRLNISLIRGRINISLIRGRIFTIYF